MKPSAGSWELPSGIGSPLEWESRETPGYLSEQLITYLGNKRALLGFIGGCLEQVKTRLGKKKLAVYDVFSGSGIAARFFKAHADFLAAGDLEEYARVINQCYLANREDLDLPALKEIHAGLLSRLGPEDLADGLISRHYAPEDDGKIRPGERVFYTRRNARYIDTCRRLLDGVEDRHRPFFLAPLLAEASVHANTSGVFKGFYKSRESGIGQFGGTNRDALLRICGDIFLPFPLFSLHSCETRILRGDANLLAPEVRETDLAYLDPPYNQHPYGSNYFMLNLICDYRDPGRISPVSGIPRDWNRSAYNKKQDCLAAFGDLLEKLKAKYLLISFNSEGFISRDEMIALLSRVGKLITVEEKRYNTFRGSRNLRNREIHVKEFLFLVEKN